MIYKTFSQPNQKLVNPTLLDTTGVFPLCLPLANTYTITNHKKYVQDKVWHAHHNGVIVS